MLLSIHLTLVYKHITWKHELVNTNTIQIFFLLFYSLLLVQFKDVYTLKKYCSRKNISLTNKLN